MTAIDGTTTEVLGVAATTGLTDELGPPDRLVRTMAADRSAPILGSHPPHRSRRTTRAPAQHGQSPSPSFRSALNANGGAPSPGTHSGTTAPTPTEVAPPTKGATPIAGSCMNGSFGCLRYHTIEHPMAGVSASATPRPARRSSRAFDKSFVVAIDGCRESASRPRYRSRRWRSNTNA